MKRETKLGWLLNVSLALLWLLFIFIIVKLSFLYLPFLAILWLVSLPFLLSIFITYLLYPVVCYLNDRGLPRWLAILLIYLLFFGGAGFAIVKGFPSFMEQLTLLSEQLPTLTETYRSYVQKAYDHTDHLPDIVHQKLNQFLNRLEQFFIRSISKSMDLMAKLLNGLLFLVIIPILVFYFLKDYPSIKRNGWKMIPKRWHPFLQQLLHDVDDSLGRYIRGQLLVCFLIGIASMIAFFLLDVPYSALLGTIIGLTDVIPYFGPVIGAIPAVIVASTISVKKVLFVVCIVAVLQFIEGNILSPLIVGKSLRMHPLVIIFVLLLGGELGGVIGMVVAVPLFAVCKVVISHLYHLRS